MDILLAPSGLDLMFRILPWGFLAIGIVFVVIGIIMLRGVSRRRRNWLPSVGNLVDAKMTSIGGDPDPNLHSFLVDYTVNGERHQGWSSEMSSVLRVGQQARIRINPDDPTEFALDTPSTNFTGVVFIVIGSVLAIVGAEVL